MLLYLSLIVIFILLCLAGLITLIVGLVQKKNNLTKIGIVLFFVSLIGCCFSGYKYAKATLEFVKTQDFQNILKEGSEKVGESAGSAISGAAEGLSKNLDEASIEKLAQKSGAILGKSLKAMASGLDSTIGTKNVYLDASLDKANLLLGRAEQSNNYNENSIELYLETDKDFKGKLLLTNYDQNGVKIDVAEKEVTLKAKKGKLEKFTFNGTTIGITTYFILSKI